MKIGDEVYVHGYVDEIRQSSRNDTIIIRNDGGYFGTIENEIYMIHTDDHSGEVTEMVKDEPQTERSE